jgi:hypothetical protein
LNRKKPKKFRERVLRLVRKKYSGEEGERFGPTLAAEQNQDPCGGQPVFGEGVW